MEFAIQVSNPRTDSSIAPTDLTLCEAIQSVFPLHTEFAIIVWNDVYIPLSYKYDISIIIDDVLSMIECMTQRADGCIDIHWPSSTFRAKWIVSWSAIEVTINSEWEHVLGSTVGLLKESPTINMAKTEYLSEWATLLYKIYTCINGCLGDNKHSFDLSRLKAIFEITPIGGRLYVD